MSKPYYDFGCKTKGFCCPKLSTRKYVNVDKYALEKPDILVKRNKGSRQG